MSQFIPLPGLRTAVKACSDDLAKARQLNTSLSGKIASVSSKQQFNAAYIATEVARLRQETSQTVSDYLLTEQTFTRFNAIRAQAEYWTLPAFLSRAVAVPDPMLEKFQDGANQTALLKALVALTRVSNMLTSLPRMTVANLTAVVDTAFANSDWAAVSAAYNEISFREDDDSRRLKYRLESLAISDLTEGNSLISEAKRTEELLGYTLRSIGDGSEDIGLRFEGYRAQNQDLETARAQAAAEVELQRQAAVIRFQMGGDYKPAA